MPSISFGQANVGGAKVGVIMGYSVPDADNTKPRRNWGGVGSAMLNPKFSIDGYYLVADKQTGTSAREFKYSTHGLGVTYHTEAGKGDTFFGLRAGLSKVETNDGAGTSLVFSPYHWGIASGYDYKLWSTFSVGFEGSFLLFDNSETTAGGTSYTEDQFRTINFSVTAKFAF